MSAGFWSELVEMNRRVDAVIGRVMQSVQPSKPVGREIPFFASIETRFENLPWDFNAALPTTSDLRIGNNVKRGIFTNGSSRVYVRELGFQSSYVVPTTAALGGVSQTYDARAPVPAGGFGTLPPNADVFNVNWRWNFQTSVQQRWYADKRVLANAGGRSRAGNHLAFREPLIIEPMETFTFECELLSFGMSGASGAPNAHLAVSMLLSGYREGI